MKATLGDDLFTYRPPPPPPRPPELPPGIPPHICEHFERIALQMVARGFKHYSARTIIHVMRHHTDLHDGTSAFKINDHISPALSRWFLGRHPELPEFFEVRERLDDSYSETP